MKIVPIEGGLGAQILGFILYEHLKTNSNEPIFASIDYFNQPSSIAKKGGGVSIFPWALDYYGINTDCIDTDYIKPSLLKRLFLNSFEILRDGTPERFEVLSKALQRDISILFPIRSEENDQALKILNLDNYRSAVIHLRRGDYLNVASHLVSDLDAINIINKIANIGIDRIIICSDSKVCLDEFIRNCPRIKKWFILEGDNIFLSHALMRLTNLLITSNSQFSFSAALLNNNGLCIFPKKWFGSSHESLEQFFFKKSDWLVLN